MLGLLTRLKQITNHPAHYLKQEGPLAGRSSKLERLSEMLEEALAVGDHALVFTQFVEMGTLLQRRSKYFLWISRQVAIISGVMFLWYISVFFTATF